MMMMMIIIIILIIILTQMPKPVYEIFNATESGIQGAFF